MDPPARGSAQVSPRGRLYRLLRQQLSSANLPCPGDWISDHRAGFNAVLQAPTAPTVLKVQVSVPLNQASVAGRSACAAAGQRQLHIAQSGALTQGWSCQTEAGS